MEMVQQLLLSVHVDFGQQDMARIAQQLAVIHGRNQREAGLLAGLALYEFDAPRAFTYPARLPLAQLDHAYVRGLTPLSLHVPRGRIWWRMSDHLPLIAEFRL